MRVLVCGGRNYNCRDAVFSELDSLRLRYGQLTIIQGGASGADALARDWCFSQRSCHLINEPADWKKYGKNGGPIRNQRMIDEHKPEVVLAFPGGRGTRDMIARARRVFIPVFIIPGSQGDRTHDEASSDSD